MSLPRSKGRDIHDPNGAGLRAAESVFQIRWGPGARSWRRVSPPWPVPVTEDIDTLLIRGLFPFSDEVSRGGWLRGRKGLGAGVM